MTAAVANIAPAPPVRWNRRLWWIVSAVLVAWSLQRAGIDVRQIFNARGASQFAEFFAAMFRPDLSFEFVKLAAREAMVTLGFAILGTALSVFIGIFGGLLLTERLWLNVAGNSTTFHWLWRSLRFLASIPRAIHEIVFGLMLVNILGLDPLVAVLAIGIPFGAVTAKVFAELLDEAPRDAERVLRASGSGRLSALLFGAVPYALGDILSYGFYRFECAIRSAAVLGLIGAGGLGFQLALSFQTLRYNEMWTLLWALILLSGFADLWSSIVRRRRNLATTEMHAEVTTTTANAAVSTAHLDAAPEDSGQRNAAQNGSAKERVARDRVLWASALAFLAAVPFAGWRLGIEVSSLWAPRARTLAGELAADSWPPQLGDEGWRGLLGDTVDTLALAILSMVLAWSFAFFLAFVASRIDNPWRSPRNVVRSTVGLATRLFLLISRSVPPPVWAFLTVFILKPGLWPGVLALGLYNLGVLGRLQAEVVENLDDAPGEALAAAGSSPFGVAAFATVPAVSGRFVSLGLYRWEVAIRETVTVGVVGAAGLGRTITSQVIRFDYDGILASILALVAVTLMVDIISTNIRKVIR